MLVALAAPVWSQQVPDIPEVAALKTLPIDLDAESSEFDRKKNRLVFRKLKIRQGPLSIDADEAIATRLDFENTRWVFSGNVVIENIGTTAWADYADILFQEHRIRNAEMTGQPVRFQQIAASRNDENEVTTTTGRANSVQYDVDSGVVSMSEEAWLSDGSNEVTGDRISYDLVREIILADADDSGQIRMKIIPPEDSIKKLEAVEKP